MAAKTVRAVKLPNGGSVLTTQIAQAVPYAEEVAILNERSRMIGWIPITDSDEGSSRVNFEMMANWNRLIQL